MSKWLVVVKVDGFGEWEHALTPGKFVFGRHPRAGLSIPAEATDVSAVSAEFIFAADGSLRATGLKQSLVVVSESGARTPVDVGDAKWFSDAVRVEVCNGWKTPAELSVTFRGERQRRAELARPGRGGITKDYQVHLLDELLRPGTGRLSERSVVLLTVVLYRRYRHTAGAAPEPKLGDLLSAVCLWHGKEVTHSAVSKWLSTAEGTLRLPVGQQQRSRNRLIPVGQAAFERQWFSADLIDTADDILKSLESVAVR